MVQAVRWDQLRSILARTRPIFEAVALAGLAGVAFLVPWEELLKLGPGLTLTRVAGLIAAAAWVISLVGRGRRLSVDRSYLWLAGYLVWAAISILWAKDRTSALGILMTLVQLAVLLVMMRDLLQSERTFNFILGVYILGAVVAGVLAIRFMLSFQEVRASIGPAQNVNNFGREIALALVFGFYLLERPLARWKKVVTAICLVPLLVSFALSQSRGAWVALVLALLVPLLFRNFRVWAAGLVTAVLIVDALGGIAKVGALSYQALSWRRAAISAAPVAQPPVTPTQVPSAGGTDPGQALQPPGANLPNPQPNPPLTALPPVVTPNDVANRLLPRAEKKRFEDLAGDRLGSRLDIWLVGWQLFEHNAIVGVGLNNFPTRFAEYVPLAHGLTTKLYPGRDPHNSVVSVAGELGAVGLVLFLGMIWSITASAWPLRKGQSVTGLIVLSLILLGALTGTDQYMKYFWLALALAPLFPKLTPSAKEREHASAGAVSHVPAIN